MNFGHFLPTKNTKKLLTFHLSSILFVSLVDNLSQATCNLIEKCRLTVSSWNFFESISSLRTLLSHKHQWTENLNDEQFCMRLALTSCHVKSRPLLYHTPSNLQKFVTAFDLCPVSRRD